MRITTTLFVAIMALFCLKSSAQIKSAKYIILIGSDGLGAYAFVEAEIPNLRRLIDEGAYTLKARSVLPSSSAIYLSAFLFCCLSCPEGMYPK